MFCITRKFYLGICWLLFFLPAMVAADVPGCKDFLSELELKPAGLEFTRCEKVEEPPSVLLRAYYFIPGEKAKAVEDFLHEKFGMERLRFVCCGWETRQATYQSANGDTYSVNMHSYDEFDFQQTWQEYEKFQVSVGKYLVLP